ncbi:MAG: sugar phosphate isomerase/epimerase family protein [Spirochaetota bacterium]
MAKFKYAAGLWALGGASDRYVPGGYGDKAWTLQELIKAAASVDGIGGVEIISSQADGIKTGDLKKWLGDSNMVLTSILANTFGDRKFKLGSLTHTDKKLRGEAVDLCRRAVDYAAEVGCPAVCLWLGSDGYDYSFQVDYRAHWKTLQESITTIAEHNRDVKVCLEYKLKEPRKYMTIGAVGKALYLARECGQNVGVVIDFGHSLMAKEKPAESLALLSMHGKLFNVHMNDAYGDWDDDMIAGAIHIQETLEFLYYVDQVGYDGWIGLDIFPFRMDGRTAAELCIRNLRSIENILNRVDRRKLARAMESLDAGNSQAVIRDAIFGD